MLRKASSVFAEVELLQKLRAEQEERQKRKKSVSILGQVSSWYLIKLDKLSTCFLLRNLLMGREIAHLLSIAWWLLSE